MTIKISKPKPTHLNNDDQHQIVIQDNDHTPWNKRPGEVNAELYMTISRSLKGGWVNFKTEEVVTYRDSRRTYSRATSVSLERSEAEKIVEFIHGGAALKTDFVVYSRQAPPHYDAFNMSVHDTSEGARLLAKQIAGSTAYERHTDTVTGEIRMIPLKDEGAAIEEWS